jgi:putative membrane protein
MWGVGEDMGWWMAFWGLFELLIVVAVVLLIANYLGSRGADRSPDDPLEIAKRRYASGQITRAEYEQLRRDLDSPVGAS